MAIVANCVGVADKKPWPIPKFNESPRNQEALRFARFHFFVGKTAFMASG